MRPLLLLALGALALVGCGSSSSDADGEAKPGSGAAANPSGKPRNDEQADMASKMQQAGNNINAQQMAAGKAMADAKAQTGGK